ncbi:MAG: hypothetical protein KDA92_08565 [Planctomycetales bacterium]|nr:hypothetical protein [Planctomycetales bacterium]
MSRSPVYCGRCRQEVERETFNFWQGTAWCSECCQVVPGCLTKVPLWMVALVWVLAVRLHIG